MFETVSMVSGTDMSGTEKDWSSGYERGRLICLTSGAAAGRQWMRDHRAHGAAFLDGFGRAIFDYLDANGLPAGDPIDGPS